MTTGITVPVSPCVWALKALQNSMMLIPCCPSAGPTGGAGEACPAFACSLIVVRTFFAICLPAYLDKGICLLENLPSERFEDQARQGRRERGVLRTRATEDAASRRSSGRSELFDLVELHLN